MSVLDSPPRKVVIGSDEVVIGSDEAGYGCWAGKLWIAAVAVPEDWKPPQGLTDSKALTRQKREALLSILVKDPQVDSVVAFYDSQAIDSRGVYRCLLEGHNFIHWLLQDRHLDFKSIADGNMKLDSTIESIVEADSKIAAVSAASIFAKVHKDEEMIAEALLYPGYAFEKHAGYGTPQHKAALEKLGPCQIHRMSYSSLKRLKRAKEEARESSVPPEAKEDPELLNLLMFLEGEMFDAR